MLTKTELIRQLQDIEWEDFEVKAAQKELPRNIWETVSAFANTAGGWIVLGVTSTGNHYDVTGVANAEKIQNDFLTAEKPIYFNSRRNTFIRTGSGDQHATDEEIDSMYRESSFNRKDEESTGLSISAIDKRSLSEFRRYLVSRSPEHLYNQYSDKAFLEKLHLMRKDRVTYGGILFLGKRDSINEVFSDFRIDYMEINGTSYTDAPERYAYRLTMEENLFQTYFAIARRLFSTIGAPFALDQEGMRVENPPHIEALREALVNLCMHADYFSPAKPRIRLFSDRIEFSNPGALPKKLELILQEDFSLPRNPVLARTFRIMSLAENVGSGFNKMLLGWEKYSGKKPSIQNDLISYSITFPVTNPPAGLVDGLVDTQQKTIKLLRENPRLSITAMAREIGISKTAMGKNINQLKKRGMLKRIGTNKNGHWQIQVK